MATRLYPNTRDINTLEALAGVPTGTKAVLDALQEQGKGMDDYEAWKLVNDHPTAGGLDHFLTFGWGRVQGWQFLQAAGLDPCCGSTSEPDVVARICMEQGLADDTIRVLQETGGVCWG